MNENIVTNANEKRVVFTVKRIIRVLSLLCIVFVFCPSFLVSCAGEEAGINVMTAVKGVPMPAEWMYADWIDTEWNNGWIVKPHIFMLVCLLIPIFVLVLLYKKKNREKQTASIILGCTAVDFVIWVIFKVNVKKIVENYYCSFRVTGWYIINLIALLLIILLSALVVLNAVGFDADLIAFFSNGGIRTVFTKMFNIVNQMSSAATQLAGNVMSDINNNKKSNEDTIAFCLKCGKEIPYGNKFCMSCGTSEPDNSPVEAVVGATKQEVKESGAIKLEKEGPGVGVASLAVAEETISKNELIIDYEKKTEQKASEQIYDIQENTESIEKRVCAECGAQLRDNVKFCTKCGTRIKLRKIDLDRQNCREVLDKNIVSQKSDNKISKRRSNKIVIAAIAVTVISVFTGGFAYIRMRRTHTENAENTAIDMQDLLMQQENEQSVQNLPKHQENEQAVLETAAVDNAEENQIQNPVAETQAKPKEVPQVIQLDSRYISRIQASSELTDSTKTYKVGYVFDGDKETCWSEGVAGTGEDEFIYIEFTSPVYISEVAFLNGYMKNETVYNANGKIKSAELIFDEESYEAEFSDWQYHEIENALYSDRFTLNSPVRTQSLSIMILEAQKGTKYEDICLSELAIWGYADDTDGDISAVALSAGVENFDIYDIYNNVIEEVAHTYGSDCEYAIYDIDHDGIVELITSWGTNNADWSNTVYTVDNSGTLVKVGEFYGMVSLYASENGNGIYSVYGHSGYQQVEWITKNGNELYTEIILSEETENYYANDNPVLLVGIDEDIMNY